jgi:archaellum component FlaF (FlaF/FlaG flagellin family)
MGLSTLYATVVFIIIFLMSLNALSMAYTSYMTGTVIESKSYAASVVERLETSIRIVEVGVDGGDVRFTVLNDGKTSLAVDCTDFYIDRQYQDPSLIKELRLLNTTYAPEAWDPGELLRMRIQYDITDSDPHEGMVIACNGATDSKIFYNN